ncbi:glycine betaine ABC transporter substrate-binding protein [Paenibacillus sp. y28]|uniref:glycine betaine ABC transporter substrate-binding protein n=1 Tax=Paenibacillus sp. y28 TaxID=3129110 RepID=UPI00301ACAE4
MKKSTKWIIAGTILCLTALLTGCGTSQTAAGSGQSGKTITIGSKNFTENIVLAHIMADLIENQTDLKVERKVNLGGSNVAWKALLNNDIQLYPEYTGTIVGNYYQQETGTSEETLKKTQELLQQDKLVFTNTFGFNNTYTLAVTQETADQYKLQSFSDLAKISSGLIFGGDFEFMDRPDGFPGMNEKYGMTFKDTKGMDHGIVYRSLLDKKVDVVDAFSTDGQIQIHHLVILKDDQSFFPPYDAGSLVRQDALETYPELKAALAKLDGQITDQDMQEMNAKVDAEGLKAQNVAHEFLEKKGLLK